MITLKKVDQNTLAFFGKTFPYRDRIKLVCGREWNKKLKRWEIPSTSLTEAVQLLPGLKLNKDVLDMYRSHIRRRERVQEIKQSKYMSQSVPGVKATLYPYQVMGLDFLDTLENGEGAILAFDMGCGKSLTALSKFVEWKTRGVVDFCLVVCPAPLKEATWAEEVRKWTDLDYIVVDGNKTIEVEWNDGVTEKLSGKKLREVMYQQWKVAGTSITIMNYELFLHDFEIIKRNMPINSRWCVILDEAHRVKSPKAQTTKNIRKLLKDAGRKILATGTPLENDLKELWSTVDFCRPNLLGNYFRFQERYFIQDEFTYTVTPNPLMIPDLMNKVETVILRKTKKEALPHLPELVVQNYFVEMTKPQRELYDKVLSGILEYLRDDTVQYNYLDALAQLTRLQQVCDSPSLLNHVVNQELPIDSGKLINLENILYELNPNDNKFIIFSQYSSMTDIIHDWLVKKKLLQPHQVGYIKGGVKADQVRKIQDGFQNGDIQCIVMTTAGNYGLNLSAGSYVICYDQLFNPQKMEQIYSRCHRNGVKNAVTAINLVTRNSYEERKLRLLKEKRELFKAVIDQDEQLFKKLFGTKADLLQFLG